MAVMKRLYLPLFTWCH